MIDCDYNNYRMLERRCARGGVVAKVEENVHYTPLAARRPEEEKILALLPDLRAKGTKARSKS